MSDGRVRTAAQLVLRTLAARAFSHLADQRAAQRDALLRPVLGRHCIEWAVMRVSVQGGREVAGSGGVGGGDSASAAAAASPLNAPGALSLARASACWRVEGQWRAARLVEATALTTHGQGQQGEDGSAHGGWGSEQGRRHRWNGARQAGEGGYAAGAWEAAWEGPKLRNPLPAGA